MHNPIRNLGERGLLKIFQEIVDEGFLPYNDDAVGYTLSNEKILIANIDTFVSTTDAPPNMTPNQMGSKATVMAISDLAAKGIIPAFTIASGVFPANFSVEAATECVKGIQQESHKYNAKFLGGDTNEGDAIILSVVATGFGSPKNIIKRNTAKLGDIICTTGLFGKTSCGFRIFLENISANKQQKEYFKKSIYEPICRVKEGVLLAESHLVTACIDSSDGLSWSLYELLRGKDKMGIEITKLPIDSQAYKFAKEKNLEALDIAFYGGEEFELIFTIPEKNLSKLQEYAKQYEINIYPFGKISKKNPGKIMYNENNSLEEIEVKGWEHFKK
ncbi:MAG: thiamine-phosphate kinase [Asgard group archaeon]|nr:thiamine-phosphate kinase [Asgard group archaeon]